MQEMLQFVGTMDQFTSMMKWVQKKIKEAGCPFSDAHKIELAMEEAIVNVICYAYPEKGQMIELSCMLVPKKYIQFRIADTGAPFNPLEFHCTVRADEGLESRVEGGLGITIIKEAMDTVEYQREGNKNVLTLFKKVP